MEIRIRPYEADDIHAMVEIWNEVVEEGVAFPQEELLTQETGAEFFASQTCSAVAEDRQSGQILGLYILHPNNVGRCGHICNASYAVRSGCRGLHIGEKLVRDCLERAGRCGYGILQFNAVVASNVHARHLYERLGFIPLGTIPGGFRMKDGHYEDICPYYHELRREPRIAVVGLGGVGGYLAGMLGRAHAQVTFVARGERLRAIRERGLVVHSDYHGEMRVIPKAAVTAQELAEQDVIFLCVKNYSLEEACAQIRHAVTDQTVIVPVMNGVDPGERVRAYVKKGTVVDALIYIVAFAGADFSVTQQGDFARLEIGLRRDGEAQRAALAQVDEILTKADIDHHVADDIEREIWRKYILNCAFNVTTAYYDSPIGEIRRDPARAREYEALVREAYQVALAKGVRVTQEHIDAIIDRFYHEYADNASSSLQRDVSQKRQSELETFSGYLVREAERLGVPAPVSARMYEALRQV